MRKVVLTGSIIVVLMIFYSLFTAESINTLKGDFKELDFSRNANNTGPVHRVYAFSVSDTLWSECKKHIDLLPHTKYGTTEAYYFLENDTSAELRVTVDLNGLKAASKEYCILYAVKDGQSRIKVEKYPFSK